MLGYTLILIAIRLSRTQIRHVLQMDGQVRMSRGSCSWVAKYTGPADLQMDRQVHMPSRSCSWIVNYAGPAGSWIARTQVQ